MRVIEREIFLTLFAVYDDTGELIAAFPDQQTAYTYAGQHGAWRSGRVRLDEIVSVTAQWRDDVRWNGWLAPAIDAWAVETVLTAVNESYSADEVHWYGHTWEWREDGALILTELSYVDEDGYAPQVIPADEDGLYPLGAFAWVWSEDTETLS